jgi:hypothetical protein
MTATNASLEKHEQPDMYKYPPVQVENAGQDVEKVGNARAIRGDYAGAVAKTDPAEIALVRKMDWRIMPTLWAMYFL